MLGEPLPPLRPHLAAAQRAGLVTAEQVSLIDTALGKVKHCDPDKVEAGEIFLVEHAAKLGYQDLDRAAAKLVEAIDPDGILPSDEAEHRLRRFFHLKQRNDGSWVGDFRLTPEAGQKLAALLGPLMKPQTTTTNPDDTDGGPGKKQVEQDERTQGQRRHDALEDIIDRTLNSDDLPASGGTPTTLIITMSWQDFTTVRGGTGTYADGSPVSAATARRLADQAEVAFCLKSEKGAVLDLYRTRRIATPTQTLALIARDGGCSLPGLRGGAAVVRTASCDRLVRGRPDQHRQPHSGVWLPSPPLRPTRLAVQDQHRRAAGVDPAEVDRPAATADHEPPDHHQQLGPAPAPRPQPPPRPRRTRPTRSTRSATGSTRQLELTPTDQDHQIRDKISSARSDDPPTDHADRHRPPVCGGHRHARWLSGARDCQHRQQLA